MAPKKFQKKKNPQRNKRQSKCEHLYSTVVTDITTKSIHNKREYYSIPIKDIYNPASVGSDADIRMIGYSIRLDLPTGNDTRTVSAALGHAGEWIRIGSADAFNQQHQTKSFSRKTLVFTKRVLPDSERHFVSPQTSDSSLVLQLDDPMGVIPGISIKITARLHFTRRIMPAFMPKASDKAVDRYEDQDINGATTAPPTQRNDVPQSIRSLSSGFASPTFTTTDTVSPFAYTNPNDSRIYTINLNGARPIKTGIFTHDLADSAAQLQTEYTSEGYEGTITTNN